MNFTLSDAWTQGIPATSSPNASLSGRGSPVNIVFGGEPALTDLLADPVVELLMRCDGVTREALETVICRARSRLRGDH